MKRYQTVSIRYVQSLTDTEKKVYQSLERASKKIDSKYDCLHCEYMNDCNEGEKCIKDYLKNKRYRG